MAFVQYLVGCLRIHVDDYASHVGDYLTESRTRCAEISIIGGSKNKKDRLGRILDAGFWLSNLSEQANVTLGRLTLTILFVNVVLSSCGVYLSTSLFNVRRDGQFRIVNFLYGSSDAFVGVYGIYVLYKLHKVGQELADAYRRVRRGLQLVAIEEADAMSPRESQQLAFLLEHYSSESPLQPLNACNINYASGASLAGLIFTYIIVLLQFKMGELSAYGNGGDVKTPF